MYVSFDGVHSLGTKGQNIAIWQGPGDAQKSDMKNESELHKEHVTHMWHDQGKWVTCRKFQFQFSYTAFSSNQNASLWCKSHYNWVSGYREQSYE